MQQGLSKQHRQHIAIECGLLIFETLIEAPGHAEHSAHGRDYFLRENELLHSFLALRILHYHEERDSSQESGRRLASLVAMKEK